MSDSPRATGDRVQGSAAPLPRLLRTVRHLRASQLAWRVRYTLRRRFGRPLSESDTQLPADARVAACDADFPDLPAPHTPDVDPATTLARLREGGFEHLHQCETLGPPPVNWQLGPRQSDRLWTITLHYHRWLDRLAELAAQQGSEADEAESLLNRYLDDWLTRCDLDQPGARSLAWNAFAIATRLGWWARAYRRLHGVGWPERNGDLHARFLASYWKQAVFLERHLEWDLRANHLLRDAVGLAWAGRFFDHERARSWLDRATQIAVAQADEQVLADGGHFERSAMYHIHVLEDFATLARLVRDAGAAAKLRATCERMAEFTAWVRHPDGEIPLFNDAALGAVSSPAEAIEMVRQLGCQVDPAVGPGLPSGGRLFAQTGLVVYHGSPWSLIFDTGQVGPDYQPGHAHADTLAVEASFAGRRLLVDPGTYHYDDTAIRAYDRATASHNTVCVDGESSSEVWHIFRVGRRARVHDVKVRFGEAGMEASAWHDGYRHLPGRPRHERRVTIEHGQLMLCDRIDGRGEHAVSVGLLVAPEWQVIEHAHGWTMRSGDSQVKVTLDAPAALQKQMRTEPYHPEYGLACTATRLCWHARVRLPVTMSVVLESC